MTHHPDGPPRALVPPLDCAAFEHHLADYLDDDLSPPRRAAARAHLDGCAACSTLVADLEGIRREAAALPLLRPSRDLWDGVAERIAAPVLPLAVAPPPARRSWLHRPWSAAAAALLLVGSTATLTWTAARRGAGDDQASPPVAVAPSPAPADVTPVPAVASPAAPEAPAAEPPASAAAPTTRLARREAATPAGPYDREIAELRVVLERQRAGLDTGTVRVVEQNLAIIERAIRESRAALAADPSSPFLNQQLNDMLGEKLELMRTAVLLSGDDE